MMEGVKNFLQFVNDNWTMIITIVGLGLGIYKKIKDYLSKSEQEKINIALEQIRKSMLELVVKAEREYGSDTGKLKKSKVLNEIYAKYPELKNIVNQEDLEKQIDSIIDENLDQMKKMLENNKDFKEFLYSFKN